MSVIKVMVFDITRIEKKPKTPKVIKLEIGDLNKETLKRIALQALNLVEFLDAYEIEVKNEGKKTRKITNGCAVFVSLSGKAPKRKPFDFLDKSSFLDDLFSCKGFDFMK